MRERIPVAWNIDQRMPKPNKVPKARDRERDIPLSRAPRASPRASRKYNMGKRKAKKRSNSTLKTTSYFKRFQVKFARRRAGEYHNNPGIASVARVFSRPGARPSTARARTRTATARANDANIDRAVTRRGRRRLRLRRGLDALRFAARLVRA